MAISLIQTKTGSTSTNASSLAVTLTSTEVGSSLIAAISLLNNGSSAVTSVQTRGGQNLNFVVSQTDEGSNVYAEIWYLDNVPAGQTSVTVNYSDGATDVEVAVYEVQGIYAAGGSLDKTDSAQAVTASPIAWTSGTTSTLSQASEIAIGCTAQYLTGPSPVITGPSSPWTNTSAITPDGFGYLMAGYKVVSATTGVVYSGSSSFEAANGISATVIATFKAGTPPPLSSVSTFYPVNVARGRRAIVRGRSASSPGARYVEFPSTFYAPHKPARGAQAAVRGSSRFSPGARYVEFPSAFYAPHKPARGAPGTRRGTSSNSAGARYIHVIPPGPSIFTLPTGPSRGKPAIVRGRGAGLAGMHAPVAVFTLPVRPAKGASAIRRGVSRSSPGAPYFHVSTFVLPVRPAKGASAIRRGVSRSSPGAPYVTFPSLFILPRKPAKGASAIRRGRGTSSPGARYVLIRISPFVLPKAPARGRAIARAGKWSAGSATGQGAPQVPRQLIISLASMAGTDDYGNSFPQGILVGSAFVGPQVEIVPSQNGSAAGIGFPMPTPDLAFVGNIASEEVDGAALMLVSGPQLAQAGAQDWVQMELWSNDGNGTPSRLQFNTIDTNGNVTEAGALINGTGWQFYEPVEVNNLTADGTVTAADFALDRDGQMTSPNGNGVFGWSETGDYPATTGDSTFGGGAGCSLSTGDFNATAINDLETLQSVANSASALANYIYLVLQDAGIIAGG